MKKRYGAWLLMLVIGVFLGLMSKPAYAIGIGKAVCLYPDSATLYIGEKQTLTLYVGGGPAPASGWRSSNQGIATVSKKGIVTAKKAGKAVITCKSGFGFDLTCKVTVKKKLEVSSYLNKNYKKLAKKAPEAIKLNKYQDPAGKGNVYVFRTSKGEEPFFRYDNKTGKITSLQISSTLGDSWQKGYTLCGVSLGMTAQKAKAALKAKKWSYAGKDVFGTNTHLNYKKSGHTITVFITNGKVDTLQWSR